MRTETDRHNSANAIAYAGEAETVFDAWTLEELDDELGSLRAAVTGIDEES